MDNIKVYVREPIKEERVFLVDTQFSMLDFLKAIDSGDNHHYQRSFFCIENHCFVDLTKSFQDNHIVSHDHLVLV